MENNYFNAEVSTWLRKRLGRFTASEIHKLFVGGRKKDQLFGTGAETYILSKAAELLTMEVKEESDFKQSEWGKANERDAVLSMETVIEMNGEHYGALNPTFFNYGSFGGCSPDWENMNEKVGADVKCPFNSAEHVRNLLLKSAEDLKEEHFDYYSQLQMSMIVRGWEKAHFFSYDPRVIEHAYNHKLITVYPDMAWREEFDKRFSAAIERLKEINKILELA